MRSLSQLLQSAFSPVFGGKRSARRLRSRTSSTAAFVEICESRELLSNVSLGTLGSANLTTERPGNIAPADPVDNYTFSLATATQVRVAIYGMTQNLDVRLLGPDLNVLGSSTLSGNSIDGFVTATIPGGASVYTVEVFGGSIGVDSDYVFQISSVATSDDVITNATPMNSSGLLDYGSSAIRSGTIGTAADFQDYYSFTLPVPQHSGFPGDPPPEDRYYISANLKGLGSTKMVELLDDFGEVLVSRSAQFFSTTFDTYLDSGTYYIRVFATESTTRSYDLTVNVGPENDLNRHALNGIRTKRFTGVLDSTPDTGRYDFKLTNPAQVRTVLSGMTSNLTLQIRNAATGALILTSNRSATIPESPVTPLLPAGEYFVQISGAAGSPYNLELTLDIDSDDTFVGANSGGTFSPLRPTYEFATPVKGQSLQDFHRLTLPATLDVRIRLSDFDRDLDVDLMNADGVVLHSEQTSGNAEDFVQAGLLAGTYFVRVFRKTPLRNLNSNYHLGVTYKPRPVAPSGVDSRFEMLEDTTRILQTANFPFTDSNTPSDSLLNVRITTLPAKGSLTLNTAAGTTPVAVGQIIPAAAIAAGGLRYRPALNEFGIGYTSFAFEVQDNGLVFEGDADRDLTSNTLTFDVIASNDAPTLTSNRVAIPAIVEDSTGDNGELVSTIGNAINDIDPGAVKGIAVIDAPTTKGRWQYALDGSNWQNIVVTNTSTSPRGLLLAADATTRVRFLPNTNVTGNVTGSASLAFRAWDQTSGTAGTVAGLSNLNPSALSPTGAELTVNVTPVNDAPTLNTANVFLPQIDEDTANPAGALVSSLLTGMSDVDAGDARGMAVRSVQNTGGVWQYSLNGGTNWTAFGSVTPATARLLPADANTRVRFVPNPNFNGNRGFSFYAWDQTSGTAGGTANLSLASAKGGTTAFSTDIELTFATQVIAAVNDLPNIAAPTTATLVVNTPLVFSTANGNALSVSDIDAGSGELQVTFTASNARFTLSTLAGITVTVGANGTSAFTVRGTLAALNAALVGSSLVGNEDYFGTGNLRLDANDLGNTGSGGPKSRGRTIQFTISALPPAISLGSLDAVSTTGFESGSFTAGTTASRFYSFTLPAAADVRVVLSGLTGNANLRLLTTSGGLINQGVNPGNFIENVLVSSLPAGTYIVAVKPTGLATSFNLSVSTATTSDNLIVNANDLGTLNATTRPTVFVSDSLSGIADRQDYFKFTTTAASPLRVSFSGLSDNYDIHLLNANGAVVSSNVLPGTNIKTIARSNLAAGTYFIRVSGFANRNLTQYDLTISLASTSDDLISQAFSLGTLDATTLPVVRRVAPSIGSNTNVQDYNSFVLTSPSDVRVNLTGLSQDIDMQLLDSFGRPIGFGSNGGNNSENVLATGLAAGTYYVRVAPFQNAGSTYELSVAIDPLSDDLLSNAISMGALSATVPTIQRTGNVNFTSDRTDYYSFTLGATTDVRVNLSGMSGDAEIILEDSFGRLITSSSQSGNSIENLLATGLTAGTYSIRVFAGTTTTSTNYLLAVSQLTALDDLITNATMLGTLTSGTLPTLRTVGSVGGSDIQDYHRFNLTTAGNLRFAVSNMSSDLDVELLDQFGQVIISGTQNGNTIERVLTPTLAVGTYYVRVFQKVGGGPVSNYNLEITTDFNGDDIIGPRTNLGFLASTPLTSSGSVGGTADTQDYYSFTLTSTRNVRFQLTGLSADIDIQVFNEFGNLIGSGTNGSSTSEDITLNGLLSGIYYIRILPFNNAVSNYSLSVTGV
jgi:hypothetical protein